MTHVSPAAAQSGSGPVRIIRRLIAAMGCIRYWFIALAARIFPAAVFWQSGQTKVTGYHLKPSTIVLFQNEYQLPLIDPVTAAYASALFSCRDRAGSRFAIARPFDCTQIQVNLDCAVPMSLRTNVCSRSKT